MFYTKEITTNEYITEIDKIDAKLMDRFVLRYCGFLNRKEDIPIPSCSYKTGLPKLPDNISPVPEDLNNLIAHKRGISVREAFDLDRERFIGKSCNPDSLDKDVYNAIYAADDETSDSFKHNALFDSKVIKEIYNKLI